MELDPIKKKNDIKIDRKNSYLVERGDLREFANIFKEIETFSDEKINEFIAALSALVENETIPEEADFNEKFQRIYQAINGERITRNGCSCIYEYYTFIGGDMGPSGCVPPLYNYFYHIPITMNAGILGEETFFAD